MENKKFDQYVIGPKEGSFVKEGSVAAYVRRILSEYGIQYFILPIDSPRTDKLSRKTHEENQDKRVREGKGPSNFDYSELTIETKVLPSKLCAELVRNIEIISV